MPSLAVAAALGGSAQHATAQTFAGDGGGQVTVYGQFSPTLQVFDDGDDTYTNLTDNDHSNSRVGFNLDQAFQDFDFRFKTELALGLPSTGTLSQENEDPPWDWDRGDIRKVEVILSGEFGSFSFGQGSMATDGAAEADLAETGMVGYSQSASDSAGAFAFRDGATGALTGIEIGDVYDSFDGGRRGRVRYDTPDFAGFSLAAAYGVNVLDEQDDDTYYDLALSYGSEVEDIEVAGALGYAWRDRDAGGTDEAWVGSVSLLHSPTGLNGTLAGGSEVDGGHYYYVKLGWIADLVAVGSTAISIDYYDGEDFVTEGAHSEHHGVQVTQYFDDIDLEAYLGYRAYAYDDDSDVRYLDASSFLAGVRWSF